MRYQSLLVLFKLRKSSHVGRDNMSNKWENDEVVQRFREYLKIPSVQPDVNYDGCVQFLKKQAEEIGLPVVVYELVAKKPVVVLTWEGTHPELPAILLNSHMDVVPVYEEHWTYPPFDAHIAEDGFVYARGAQDMKCVGMQHLEAIRRLKSSGVRLKRTVHISFVPDEEIGGAEGMQVFSESQEFKRLNVGFELDESCPNDKPDEIYVFNGERTIRQIKVTCRGNPSHGSLLLTNTAGEKIYYLIDKFMKFRAEEKKKLDAGTPLGDVTTVNLTMLEGGVQVNVLPETLSAFFDLRIAPDVDHAALERMIDTWCTEAGENVTYEYLLKNPEVKSTKTDGLLFWDAIKKVVNDLGLKINCQTCPGGTDARFIRRQGIPAISLTPIVNTPLYVHCHDERVHVEEYKKGIVVMQKIVEAVANV